jgi:hypothetical protein
MTVDTKLFTPSKKGSQNCEPFYLLAVVRPMFWPDFASNYTFDCKAVKRIVA